MRFPALVSVLVAILAPSVHAQSNSQAKIQPHLVPVGGNNLCSPANAILPCAEIETAGDLNPAAYYAYILVTDGNSARGVAGLQLGIDYDGVEGSGLDIYSWTRCADLDFSSAGWPGAGTGSIITWSPSLHCQYFTPGGPGTGVVAAAGYFYLAAYSPDALRIVGHPTVGNAKVADCNAAESIIPASSLGTAQFSAGGVVPGISPCVGVGPSEPTCSIQGPSSVIESTTTTFQVDSNVPVASIGWSISGNGYIIGPSTGETVQVQAGPNYWYTLEVTFVTETGPVTCSRTIDIVELSCSISGPSVVDANTTSSYELSTNVAGAQIQWTISGSGTIVGGNTTQVQVLAGDGGQFVLTVSMVFTGGGVGECSKGVEINDQEFPCSISGAATVTAGSSGNVYVVTTEFAATSFQWLISGNGTMSGSTTNQVTVTVGSAGSFTLSVTYSGPGSSGSCSKTVTVEAAPPPSQMTCSVSGPGSLVQGAGGVYSVTSNPVAQTWLWSVTGNGTISGGVTGSTVQVVAGAVESFTVSVTVTSGSQSTVCSKNVVVQALPPQMTCSVSGPASLVQGATGVYSVTSNPAAESWSWSVSGNGVINGGSTGPTVQVVAGAPGTFMVSVAVTSSSLSSQCSRSVSVFASQPEGPNQAQAKIALHLTAPSSKNACAVRPGCGSIDTYGPGLYPAGSYYAYCLVADGYTSRTARSGVAGAQFGIHYNNAPGAGVDVFSWTLCATLDFPSTGWPASGGGNLITWDGFNACQQFEPEGAGTGVVATLGYFYLAAHSPDQLFITPRPVDGQAKVANCYGAESVLSIFPSALGVAGFGGFWGYVPCGVVIPVENTTWSRIKTMIRDN